MSSLFVASLLVSIVAASLSAAVFPGSTDFESVTMEDSFFGGTVANASLVTDASVATAISDADRPLNVSVSGYSGTRDKVLSVDSDESETVFRKLNSDGAAAALSSGDVYTDMLVKFSLTSEFEEHDSVANAKFLVYLKAITNNVGEVVSTNLCVRAGGYVANGVRYAAEREYVLDHVPVAKVEPDTWYRLVVKAVANVGNDASAQWPGFEVYLGGADEAHLCSCGGTNQFVSITANGSTPGSIASIGFSGTGSIDDLIVSTFDPESKAATITDTDGSSSTRAIAVSKEWVAENAAGGASSTPEQIAAALNATDANGNKGWQNYVLGIGSSTALAADVPQGTNTNVIAIRPNVNPPDGDTGFNVTFSIDKITESGTTIAAGSETDIDSLGINVSDVTSNAFYKVNVFITASN